MAMQEEYIQTYLEGHAGLIALVGNRIYVARAPDKPTFPYVVYQKVGGPRSVSHSGNSKLATPRVQFSCWGNNYWQAKEVAEQIVIAFNGQKGNYGSAIVANELDDPTPEINLHRVIVDVTFVHEED